LSYCTAITCTVTRRRLVLRNPTNWAAWTAP